MIISADFFEIFRKFAVFSGGFFCSFFQTASFWKNIDIFCNINAPFLKYAIFEILFARFIMRKITSYLSLPVISGSNQEILGTITGVLCDKRLKTVEFFTFSDLFSAFPTRYYVAQRSLKRINDDSVVLSNLLCIKNDADIFGKDLVEFPLGAPVYTSDGKALGVLSDLYFGDTDKKSVAVIVNDTPVLVERVATVDAQGVVLLPDGKKRIRKKKSPVIEKPEKDFQVSLFDANKPSALPVKALSNYGFLIGRVATASVYDKDNRVIVKKGALVTQDIVFNAHRKNRLIALTLSSKP